jgi:hypothetical protein
MQFSNRHFWAFIYSIINIHLNVPCYFASIEEMTNDCLINKIYNKKDGCLFHIFTLKPNENHMNVMHVQMIKMFPLLQTSI